MRGVKELEKKLLSMSSHSYDAIDKEMKKICKKHNITPKELHDNFKKAHNGKIPDEWVKEQNSTKYSEMCGPDCKECPKCEAKKKMMALGYSEKAIDSIIEEFAEKYGEKKGLWENIHRKRERIKRGSGERMRRPGEKGAPSAADIKAAGADDESKNSEPSSKARRQGEEWKDN
jgi:hypothetical protein